MKPTSREMVDTLTFWQLRAQQYTMEQTHLLVNEVADCALFELVELKVKMGLRDGCGFL